MHDVRPFLPWPFEEPGNLLYVGFRPDACAWLTELAEAGNEVTVLEIWPPNVTGALGDPRVARFIVGDVRRAWTDGGALEPHYDYVWWWHGPEHVEKAEFPATFVRLCFHARRMVACAAPWGRYDQGPHLGNDAETHLWSVREINFLEVGMEVRTDGEEDQPGSEIVGWAKT